MKKKEYIILAVIIILLGGYLFLRNNDRSRYVLPALEAIADGDITRIEIIASGEAIGLSRDGEHWRIGENAYPADASSVSDMLSTLSTLTLTALVSETGVYSPYDLTGDKEIGVRAWTGDRMVRDLALGKAANTYQHTFVRIGEDPNVYHADGSFRQTFDQTLDSLRDKTALTFATGDITAIDIVSGEKHLVLALEEAAPETPSPEDTIGPALPETAQSVWMKSDGTPADAEAVQRLLSQLAYLNCSGYLEDGQKDAFSNPTSTVTLKGADTMTLSVFEKAAIETGCPALSSQNDYPFTLDDTACTRLSETLGQILGTGTEDGIASDLPGDGAPG
jgi:hypothetical protein